MVSWAIVGASRGLGLEFVRQLSETQSNVIFAIVRNKATATDLVKFAASKDNVHIVTGDLNSLPTLQEAAKGIAAVTGGGLDILVNNGAYLDTQAVGLAPTQLTEPEHFETAKDAIWKSVESNFLGAIYVTNAFLPLIEHGKEKKIIYISTGMADNDLVLGTEIPNSIPYSTSKAMLNHVVAKYAVELRPKDIHVVAISPGWVDTSPVPQEALDWMVGQFRKVEPKLQGRISKEESVRDQLETISKLNWDVQGRMVSHHGNFNWF